MTRLGLAALCLGLLGCSVSNPLYCDRETPCATGQVCNTVAHQCAPPRPGCSDDGWCAEAAPPVVLRRAFAYSSHDVWLAGDGGVVFRWDGTALVAVPSGVTAALLGLWGSPSGELWFSGATGTLLRRGEAGFVPVPTNTMVPLLAVWGSAPDDIWIVGAAGTLLHYNGAAVTAVAVPTKSDLYGVWGSGPHDVWAVGVAGTILHYDGSAWTLVPNGTPYVISAVWGSGPQDVWFAVLGTGQVGRIQGGMVQLLESGTKAPFYAVWGTGADDVWFAGTTGSLIHHDGSGFQAIKTPTPAAYFSLTGEERPGGSIFAVGPAAFHRYAPLAP